MQFLSSVSRKMTLHNSTDCISCIFFVFVIIQGKNVYLLKWLFFFFSTNNKSNLKKKMNEKLGLDEIDGDFQFNRIGILFRTALFEKKI